MKKNKKLTLSILPEKIAICHFDKNSLIPKWALEEKRFVSIAKTSDELSIICPEDKIPGGVLVERGWRAFKLLASLDDLDFTATGIVSSLAAPLAKAKISIFCISTYETNYILVEEKNFIKAKRILSSFCNIKE
jgi:hypothetical protein